MTKPSRTIFRAAAFRLTSAGVALFLGALVPSAGEAQDFGGAFSGFSSKSNAPIQIEADRLEVRDADKLAVYSGHVRVLQGETILEAPELRIFYKGGTAVSGSAAPAAAAPAAAAPATAVAGSQVTRIEAGPGVTVHSGDRVATGDRIVFDVPKDLVTLEGNVLLSQGQNVVHGDRLIVNLATKEGRVEGGRVQTLITPSGGAKPR